MANVLKQDVKLPFTEDGSGGLEIVTGRELASQRILYGYGTTPGDIVHRPEWGADLEAYANRKPTPDRLQRLENQAGRFLRTLPFLEDFSVDTFADGESSVVDTRARTDEGELLIPETVI